MVRRVDEVHRHSSVTLTRWHDYYLHQGANCSTVPDDLELATMMQVVKIGDFCTYVHTITTTLSPTRHSTISNQTSRHVVSPTQHTHTHTHTKTVGEFPLPWDGRDDHHAVLSGLVTRISWHRTCGLCCVCATEAHSAHFRWWSLCCGMAWGVCLGVWRVAKEYGAYGRGVSIVGGGYGHCLSEPNSW